MKSGNKISVLHVVLLSMTVIGLKNHVTILPPILEMAGRDGWASVLLGTLAILPWLFLLVYIHKQSKQARFTDWLKQKIGKRGSTFVRYIIVIYLLLLASFTMRETLQWMSTTFLPWTPLEILLVIYTILCIWLATTNLQTIVTVNVLVLFGVVIFGFFVATVNIQVKNYELLRPFFEHGFRPILQGMVYPMSGYAELLLLLFFQHQIKDRLRWHHFFIIILILLGLTLGPLVGAITEFGPDEAAKQRYPAYEEWGLVTIGRFIEHLDFLSIYQWLTGAFIRIGFILYIVVILLEMTDKPKHVWSRIAPAFFFLCLALIPLSDPLFIELKGSYMLTGTFFFLLILSLFFGYIARKQTKSTKNA